MVFQNDIVAGASGAGGGYTIDQSIRFNDNDSAYMSRTSGATGDRQKWTFSAWVKRGTFYGGGGVSSNQRIFHDSGNNNWIMFGYNGNEDVFRVYLGADLRTTALFRDASSWYHMVVAVDTTQATSSDRVKIYQNGVQITSFSASGYPSLNYNTIFNNSGTTYQISGQSVSEYFDGYISEFHWIDGQQLAPTDFGELNDDGVWIPKAYEGTYGTNGFYITGEDSADLGADYSGNGNDFTSSGLTSDDQVSDTPTANSCTMNILDRGGPSGNVTLSDGNLVVTANGGASNQNCRGTFAMTTGKWYWEMAYTSGGSVNQRMRIGICDNTTPIYNAHNTRTAYIDGYSGNAYYVDASSSTVDSGTYVTFGNGDHMMFAFDADAGKLWFGKNGTWMGSPAGDPAAGTGASLESIPTGERWQPLCSPWVSNQGTFYFLEDTWTYTAPTGFKALNTANLPTPTIADGSAYFQTTLFTGTGAVDLEVNQSENSTFQPDFVWAKQRNKTDNHILVDAVRVPPNTLYSNQAAAEVVGTGGITSLDADGFTVSGDGSVWNNINQSGINVAAWQWLAGNGTASNEDGSISSTVSVNDTAKFSIVSWTATGTGSDTIGHGLGVQPSMIIKKERSAGDSWFVQNINYTDGSYSQFLEGTQAQTSSAAYWNSTFPTSTVFSQGTVMNSGNTCIAYCWAEVDGFSKFGKYTGNGSADGPFVWCGFRPAYDLIKVASTTGSWFVYDTARDTYNASKLQLFPNLTSTEDTSSTYDIDIVSNGFKIRSSNGNINTSSGTHIFMAFAEHPFGGDGVAPVPAR